MKGNSLKIDFQKNKITGKLQAKVFQNEGYWIFYVPSLDLSSYAETIEDAEKFFFEVYLNDFFENVFKNPKQGLEELESLGWKRDKVFKKQFVSDSYVNKDGFLKEFDLPEGTEVVDIELAV